MASSASGARARRCLADDARRNRERATLPGTCSPQPGYPGRAMPPETFTLSATVSSENNDAVPALVKRVLGRNAKIGATDEGIKIAAWSKATARET